MGGYLSKSHSGKWNLECLLVIENSFFLTCVFSVAASLLQKGLSSCLSYPPVFSELGIFSETTHHKSLVFQSSPCGGLDEEGVPG